MPTMVEKIHEDGTAEVLHANLADDDAMALARNVIAGNTAEVQVRLTKYVWSDETADYVLDFDGAVVVPRLPEPEPPTKGTKK